MAKAPLYFQVNKFVDEVIKAMKIGKTSDFKNAALREEIEARLGDRIIVTVINSMETRELKIFESLMVDHPELDEIDALMVMAPNMPGLKEKLERNINSLYAELAYDAERIEESLKANKP
jgi:hypothetical protein